MLCLKFFFLKTKLINCSQCIVSVSYTRMIMPNSKIFQGKSLSLTTKDWQTHTQWDKSMSSRKPGWDSLIDSNTTTPLSHFPLLSRWDSCPLFLRMTLSTAPSSLAYSRHCFNLRLILPSLQGRLSKCSSPAYIIPCLALQI